MSTVKTVQVGNIVVYGIDSEADLPREVLGGKGYSLVEMAKAGLNVPKAVILPCSYGALYLKSPIQALSEAKQFIEIAEDHLTKDSAYMPLLSCRSGARVSMAGMMDTILNIGITPSNLPQYKEHLGDTCAINCMERLLKMMLTTSYNLKPEELHETWTENSFLLEQHAGTEGFPNRFEQLEICVQTVFDSWNNDRAKYYRKMNNIPDEWGTAVIIQQMVFGNMNDKSCTGVLFTSNPDTGEHAITGEYLVNAQGEDVVSGEVTPLPLETMEQWNSKAYKKLISTVTKMEKDWQDALDIEFTVENGELYFLQCRAIKRTAVASLRLAISFFMKGLAPIDKCLSWVSPKSIDLAVQDRVSEINTVPADAKGIPACTGVVCGIVSFKQEVIKLKANQKNEPPYIFVAPETTPDDLEAMHLSAGVITYNGGSTSHASVVARSMNKPCIVGVHSISPNANLKEGDAIIMCGATGQIWTEDIVGVDITKGDEELLNEFIDTFATALNIRVVPQLLPAPFCHLDDTGAGIFDGTLNPCSFMADSILGIESKKDNQTFVVNGFIDGVDNPAKIEDLDEYMVFEGKALYTGKELKSAVSKKMYEAVLTLREKLYGTINLGSDQIILSKSQFLSVLLNI